MHAQKRWEVEQGNRSAGRKGSIDGERVGMIEDRLAVLERIATDRGQLLSDEIDALRIENQKESTEA